MKTHATEANFSRRNKVALIISIVSALLVIVLMALPIFQFSTEIGKKRSGNTRIGDETFQTVLAELEETATAHEAESGNPCTITYTENANTKKSGETTYSVMFYTHEIASRTGYDFMASGLPGGRLLLVALLCVVLAPLCMVLGLQKGWDTHPKHLTKRMQGLRGLACWLLLIALILLPVFIFVNNLTFVREAQIVKNGGEVPAFAEHAAKIGQLLYGDADLETVTSNLNKISLTPLWSLLALGLCIAASLLAAILCLAGSLTHTLVRGLLYLFVMVLCVVILYPYFVMFITAFRGKNEMIDMYFLHLLPTQWFWSNMGDIIRRDVLYYLRNSILMASGATALALLCGIPAAYAMARMRFRGRSAFLGFIIMSQMFAPVVLLVGISTLMRTLHLSNTLWGLMFFNAAFNQAFAIWLLRGTFLSISPEMEQAATIDGCNSVSALIKILLPMAAPGIVTTTIFVFINAWNEYTVATVLIRDSKLRPISTGITQFSSFNMIEWNYLFAAALLATIPVVILFVCIEKHLAAGLTAGGVKG